MIRIKICGLTTYQDAVHTALTGCDMLGLNFYPPSPRYLQRSVAREIVDRLRQDLNEDCPQLVGVFVNETPDHIHQTMVEVGLDSAQLSGDEPVGDLITLGGRAFKSIRPSTVQESLRLAGEYLPYAPEDERLPALLLDAYHPDLYGGIGQQTSDDIARAVNSLTPRLMLAGGLTPENVGGRVKSVQPWGVDVASGVEGPGKGRKDIDRIKAFIKASRHAYTQ